MAVKLDKVQNGWKTKGNILLETLIDSMADFIFYKNRKGVYEICNKAFAKEFVGSNKTTILGKTDEQLFRRQDPDKLSFILAKDHEVFGSGAVVRAEWQTVLANGKEATLETIKTPLKNGKGDILGIVGVSRDITGRKQLEKSLEKKMKDLEFLNKLMVDREVKMVGLKKTISELQKSVDNNK